MTNQEKKDYNKQHYKKNRSEILRRVRSKQKAGTYSLFNVIPLFKAKTKSKDEGKNGNEGGPVQPSKCSLRKTSGTLFLHLQTLANFYFLITETAHFYAAVDGNNGNAYLKALLLEGAIFSFSSMLRVRGALTGILHKFIILIFCSYSVWAISSSVVQRAFYDRTQFMLHEKAVLELEREVSKKTVLRDSYFQENRITLASKMDQALDALKLKIEQTRSELSKSPDMVTIWNTLLSLVLFRVLVMISNLFCLKELTRRYRIKFRTV